MEVYGQQYNVQIKNYILYPWLQVRQNRCIALPANRFFFIVAVRMRRSNYFYTKHSAHIKNYKTYVYYLAQIAIIFLHTSHK